MVYVITSYHHHHHHRHPQGHPVDMMQGLSGSDKKTFQEGISNATHHATSTLALSSDHLYLLRRLS